MGGFVPGGFSPTTDEERVSDLRGLTGGFGPYTEDIVDLVLALQQ